MSANSRPVLYVILIWAISSPSPIVRGGLCILMLALAPLGEGFGLAGVALAWENPESAVFAVDHAFVVAVGVADAFLSW